MMRRICDASSLIRCRMSRPFRRRSPRPDRRVRWHSVHVLSSDPGSDLWTGTLSNSSSRRSLGVSGRGGFLLCDVGALIDPTYRSPLHWPDPPLPGPGDAVSALELGDEAFGRRIVDGGATTLPLRHAPSGNGGPDWRQGRSRTRVPAAPRSTPFARGSISPTVLRAGQDDWQPSRYPDSAAASTAFTVLRAIAGRGKCPVPNY